MRFDSRGLVSTYISDWMPLGDVTRQAVAGYFAGGYNGLASGYVSIIDKMSFPSDTLTVNADSLSNAGTQVTGFSNSGVAGYACGVGYGTIGESAIVNKITYATDTRSTTTALGLARRGILSLSNYGVAGYAGGGYDAVGSDFVSRVDKFAFPADSRTTTTSLANTRFIGATFQNNGVAGYFAGGIIASAAGSSIEKLAFPADTRTTLSATLSSANQGCTGFANSEIAGYVLGGYDATYIATVDRISLVNDTKTTITSLANAANSFMQGFSNSGVAGYAGGGAQATVGEVNTVKKMSFSSETISNTTNLSGNRGGGAGFANEGVF